LKVPGNRVISVSVGFLASKNLKHIYVDDKNAAYLKKWKKDETASFVE
jgi:hypothetical protein